MVSEAAFQALLQKVIDLERKVELLTAQESSALDGGGTAGQVAYFDSTNTITSDSTFTHTGGTSASNAVSNAPVVTSGNIFLFTSSIQPAPTGNTTAVYRTLAADVQTQGSNNYTNSLPSVPLLITGLHNGTGTMTVIQAMRAAAYKNNTGAVTEVTGLYLKVGNRNATNAVTAGYGVYIDVPYTTGSITNCYGVYLVNQIEGTGNRYAFYSEGGESRFYAGSTSVTPVRVIAAASATAVIFEVLTSALAQQFAIGATGQIRTNQTASATGPVGSIVAKLPIYNASGTLVGYVPLYNSIT